LAAAFQPSLYACFSQTVDSDFGSFGSSVIIRSRIRVREGKAIATHWRCSMCSRGFLTTCGSSSGRRSPASRRPTARLAGPGGDCRAAHDGTGQSWIGWRLPSGPRRKATRREHNTRFDPDLHPKSATGDATRRLRCVAPGAGLARGRLSVGLWGRVRQCGETGVRVSAGASRAGGRRYWRPRARYPEHHIAVRE
jgi:hypothetical protein